MRSKSPEKRGRQKVVRTPTYRIENLYNPEAMPQYFQVAVNVFEARNLAWTKAQSSASYVIVILGKKKQRTSIRTKMEKSFKGEILIFDLRVCLRDLQRSNLWFAVVEPKCSGPRLLGEASLCLGEIWTRQNHEVFQKWVQLIPSGFLKVNVKITLKGEVEEEHAIINDEKIEDSLILSGSEQQCTNYIITIYEGFGLTNGGSKNYKASKKSSPRSTFVRLSFCGLTAKTSIQPLTDNTAYCEQLSMVEMFPNINQIIYIEVWTNEGCFIRMLGSVRLNLSDISHHGENGFLPTFGPSLLHLYGMWNVGSNKTCSDDPYYCGTLLVACKVVVPYYQQNFRSVTVEPVMPICLDNLWTFDDFCIYCPIFEVSMLNRSVSGKYCGIAITVGEMNIDNKSDKEFMLMSADIKSRKLHYTGSMEVLKNQLEYGYLDFSNAFPVLQFASRLPDFRFRMYRNNMISGIAYSLEIALNAVEGRLQSNDYSSPAELIEELKKALDDASGSILKFLDIIQRSNIIVSRNGNVMKQCMTELDQKQMTIQKEEIEKIYKRIFQQMKCSSMHTKDTIFGSKKTVKVFLADMRMIAQEIKELLCNSLEGWPDIVVWLLSGGSRVGYTKISTADVIYSVTPEQSGKNCGRIQTISMKPLKCSKHQNLHSDCYCIAGKVELLVWMGLYQQKPAFDSCIPGYVLKMRGYDMYLKSSAMMVECRAYIYKAKLKSDSYGLNSLQTFLRINALNTVKDTKVKCKTLTPVWNQVLKIQRMVFMTPERLANSPAIVLVEVYNTELSGRTELIGRFEVKPSVFESQDTVSAPKLQWYNMYRGAENSGQVLMFIQLTQIPERLLKNIIYSQNEESYIAEDPKEPGCNEELVPLPEHLFPTTTTYKVDVYWWGLRNINIKRKLGAVLEIEDLSIRSDIITDKRSNCNFPNGRMSQIFDAPWSEAYSPMFNIRLFDSSTFGRTQYLDTNAVKNPNKYVVNWLAKADRDLSLKCASVTSTEFVQVNRTLFIKKGSETNKECIARDSKAIARNMVSNCTTKHCKWKSLFWQRELDEEEYTLLPMFSKVNKNKLITKTDFVTNIQKDWWVKYTQSKEDRKDKENFLKGDKLIIFDSELENQPEFTKFKDWCTTLKLYNGKKTGIPVNDEELYSGLLKAGLAIYRWPPPDTKTAVTYSGIELNRGYFDDHPNNDDMNFLVRVYVVRGFNLKIKDFVRNTTPYAILNCGDKQLGNRNDYLPSRTRNPIFGKIYELRCSLPEDYLLSINLYNYDDSSLDELIGSTTIDLENRIYSRHRARVGLPFEYSINDVLKWRDGMKPSAILEELCSKNHIPSPFFIDNNTLVLNGVEYKDNERDNSFTSSVERKENLCLSILHKWYTLPVCGYHLVPEHVETRTLYNPDRPGIEQGKLHLWVDIFPLDTGVYIPPCVDITPKKLEDYELRVTVYAVRDVKYQDFYKVGSKPSGIYVKAWIGFAELSQNTDVDYQSINGESNFNWRMIFQFLYQPEVRELACKEETILSYYDEVVPPILNVQLMDNEALPPNDCLGSLTLNLNAMPNAGPGLDDSKFDVMNGSDKINLFYVRSHRAWWPLVFNDCNSKVPLVVGKIDLELNLLPQNAASLMPVGLGREPPFPLPKPVYRVESSYELCNKIKIIYRNYKPLIIFIILCSFIAVILFVFYFEIPSIILEYWSLQSRWYL